MKKILILVEIYKKTLILVKKKLKFSILVKMYRNVDFGLKIR